MDAGDTEDGRPDGDSTAPLPSPAHFIDDQNLVIHEHAVAGDLVGHAKPYPTVKLNDARFSLVEGNGGGVFSIDAISGAVRVAKPGLLDAKSRPTMKLTVNVRAAGRVDSADLTITVLAESDVVFIDPTNSRGQARDGTIGHPFSSLTEVTWKANMACLFRRGTTLTSDSHIVIGADNVLLGAYGSGARPIFRCTETSSGNIHAVSFINRTGVTIRDLEIDATDKTSCLRFAFTTEDDSNLTIDNCDCHGSGWGIRAFAMKKVAIVYTEVHDIKDDGIFVMGMTDFEVGYNDVHDVNQKWIPPYTPQDKAGGDAIQLVECDKWRVHHNRLDRTNSGNKFCFISANVNRPGGGGILEHNHMVGPLTDGDGGASVYLGKNQDEVHVRYNFLLGPSPGAIYSHTNDLRVYGNIIANMPDSCGVQSVEDKPCSVYNNTFFNVKTHVRGVQLRVHNNIFDLTSDSEHTAIEKLKTLEASNNLFTRDPGFAGVTVGDPLFMDAAKLDFHLKPGSAAIDRGKELGLGEDLERDTVPLGAGPDIGAYEDG